MGDGDRGPRWHGQDIVSLISGDGLDLKPSGFIGSIVGATLVLLVVRAVSKKKPAT